MTLAVGAAALFMMLAIFLVFTVCAQHSERREICEMADAKAERELLAAENQRRKREDP